MFRVRVLAAVVALLTIAGSSIAGALPTFHPARPDRRPAIASRPAVPEGTGVPDMIPTADTRARRAEALGLADTVALDPRPASPGGYYGWGASVSAAGDVNRDGFADFLVSNNLASPWGTYGVALYLGSESGPVSPPAWYRLTFTVPAVVSAAGDVNNDGYDDIIIGAGTLSPSGTGIVEVWLGASGGFGESPQFSTSGGPSFGYSVCTAGDVNDDGYDDVIIGAPLAASCNSGGIYLLYGSSAGVTMGSRWQEVGTAGCDVRMGYTVAGLGDINGDGFDDFGAGSFYDEASVDTLAPARIYLGSKSGPHFAQVFSLKLKTSALVAPAGDADGDGYADCIISDPSYPWTFYDYGYSQVLRGGPSGWRFLWASAGEEAGGISFTAGDVNGDGVGDFLVDRGFGSDLRAWEGRLGSTPSNPTALLIPSGEFRTSARAAGDVNGDGFGDVVVGMPSVSQFGANSGKVLLYYGRANVPGAAVAGAGFGGQSGALAGWSLSTGDVNGDGYDDVMVGKPGLDANGYIDNGGVELHLGGPGTMPSTPDWTASGLTDGANAGIAVALGQDVNGDGYGDVLVGAHWGNSVYVWYGRPSWTSASTTPDQILVSPQADALFGASVAFAGDVNGDGFADVVVGAPYWLASASSLPAPIPYPHAGNALLYLGSLTGLVPTTWNATLLQTDALEGTSVASAGDVNSDGFSDVIIGSGSWDSSLNEQGHARVFLGSASGLSLTADAEWKGAAASEYFGNAVAGIGDFDGDGYGDVAIGAFGTATGGEAYVIRGGPSGPDSAPTWTYSVPGGSAFGNAVSGAGDINGDGYSDLLVGEVFGSTGGLADCGNVRVFLGGEIPPPSSYVTYSGDDDFVNLGHAVAGGGDINGDGFGDILTSEPRRWSSYFDEGQWRVHFGNSRSNVGPLSIGHSRPVHSTEAMPSWPIAIYGRSWSPSAFGLACQASSAGGRDEVGLLWRVSADGVLESTGRTSWQKMADPTAPLGGAIQLTSSIDGLTSARVYAWKTRVLSRSPWFRYGMWQSPQPNGRGQWDIRTAPANIAVEADSPATELAMAAPWPNPAGSAVRMAFSLPRAGSARLTVRDVQGRLVRTLVNGSMPAGSNTVRWNCAAEDGRPCTAGLYFLELESNGERRVSRVAIVR